MAFFAIDTLPGPHSADLYEPPYVIGVEAGKLEDLELALNVKLLSCKLAGRVLAVSEIRVTVASSYGPWYSATIVWCKRQQIETGIPRDQEDPDELDEHWGAGDPREYEPDFDDEPPPDVGSHPGAIIREYETQEGPF